MIGGTSRPIARAAEGGDVEIEFRSAGGSEQRQLAAARVETRPVAPGEETAARRGDRPLGERRRGMTGRWHVAAEPGSKDDPRRGGQAGVKLHVVEPRGVGRTLARRAANGGERR